MLFRLLTFFILLPIAEVYVLVKAGNIWGGMNVFFTVIFMAIIGFSITRNQGKFLLAQVQLKISRGEVPAIEMLEGVMVFIGGLMFLIPGFVSDVIGLTMVIPGLRKLWAQFLFSRFSKMAKNPKAGAAGFRAPGAGFVFYSNMGGASQTRPSPFDITQTRDVSPKQIIDIKPEQKPSGESN